ncbi:MAG TPA: ABC transporter ATP-binding protein [Anaerolineales bacterium]|nr:ABC transporter ATP-binding protein [Anaerolineales bacterium]
MFLAVSTVSLSHAFQTPRGAVTALRDVTLPIERGAFFGLFGPNGAGKSTFIRVLSTLIIPTGGQASVMGCDVVREAEKVRASIGLVSANESSFYGRLTGRQNLEFFGALQNIAPAPAQRRAAELLEMFDLAQAADSYFQSYSTGMRQRLNVARALLHNPPVLFLDEPTKGMDLVTAEKVRSLLRREIVERQGKTVLLTTHDLDEMETMCDRVAILEHGSIRASGSPAELIRQASATVEYRLELSNVPLDLLPMLSPLSGVQSVELVSQTAAVTVLDLTFSAASPSPELWQTLARHNITVKRYAPKDEGLRMLMRDGGSASTTPDSDTPAI